jgi:glutathione S-transferase
MPPITLYFLQGSRSIRTAWLLEELELDYEVKFSERVNNKAPESFKLASGNPLGKFPTLKDDKLTIYESGAISE